MKTNKENSKPLATGNQYSAYAAIETEYQRKISNLISAPTFVCELILSIGVTCDTLYSNYYETLKEYGETGDIDLLIQLTLIQLTRVSLLVLFNQLIKKLLFAGLHYLIPIENAYEKIDELSRDDIQKRIHCLGREVSKRSALEYIDPVMRMYFSFYAGILTSRRNQPIINFFYEPVYSHHYYMLIKRLVADKVAYLATSLFKKNLNFGQAFESLFFGKNDNSIVAKRSSITTPFPYIELCASFASVNLYFRREKMISVPADTFFIALLKTIKKDPLLNIFSYGVEYNNRKKDRKILVTYPVHFSKKQFLTFAKNFELELYKQRLLRTLHTKLNEQLKKIYRSAEINCHLEEVSESQYKLSYYLTEREQKKMSFFSLFHKEYTKNIFTILLEEFPNESCDSYQFGIEFALEHFYLDTNNLPKEEINAYFFQLENEVNNYFKALENAFSEKKQLNNTRIHPNTEISSLPFFAQNKSAGSSRPLAPKTEKKPAISIFDQRQEKTPGEIVWHLEDGRKIRYNAAIQDFDALENNQWSAIPVSNACTKEQLFIAFKPAMLKYNTQLTQEEKENLIRLLSRMEVKIVNPKGHSGLKISGITPGIDWQKAQLKDKSTKAGGLCALIRAKNIHSTLSEPVSQSLYVIEYFSHRNVRIITAQIKHANQIKHNQNEDVRSEHLSRLQ